MVGECFIEQSLDDARSIVNQRKKTYENEYKDLVNRIESTKKRMNELKIILYAKFGKSINLEEEEN